MNNFLLNGQSSFRKSSEIWLSFKFHHPWCDLVAIFVFLSVACRLQYIARPRLKFVTYIRFDTTYGLVLSYLIRIFIRVSVALCKLNIPHSSLLYDHTVLTILVFTQTVSGNKSSAVYIWSYLLSSCLLEPYWKKSPVHSVMGVVTENSLYQSWKKKTVQELSLLL